MANGTLGYKVRTITCQGCGTEVTGHLRPDQRYCSLGCYRKGARPQRRTGATRECAQCSGAFYVTAGRAKLPETRFCSRQCADSWQGRNKTEHTCKICGETFRWSPSRTSGGKYNVTYCSLACRDADPERAAALLEMNAIQSTHRRTNPERIGYGLLESLSLRFEAQAIFAGKFCVDALLPDHQAVVQFDGDYWHDRKGGSVEPRILRRVALDRSQDAYMRACGWTVIRLWESDLKGDLAGCAEKIRQHLRLPS
jgi:very-short-patch-repair endonuclease